MPAEKPTEISILILDEATMLTVASILDPLRAANRLAQHQLFTWKIHSPRGHSVKLIGGFEMQCDGLLSNSTAGDALIVIASFNQHLHADTALIGELQRRQNHYSIIAGVEAGAWLLARAGITAGKKVTTHWEDLEAFATRWSDTEVVPDRFVIDGSLWTCGGASPALDMMLELIALKAGKALAMETASVFIYNQVHAPHDRQAAQSLGKLETVEPRIAVAVRLMEKNLDSPLPVPAIAKRIGLSPRMLELLFSRHLGMTPGRYYQRLRLLTARKLLRDTAISVQEVAVRAGFTSQSAFSRTFKKAFGESPSSLRHTANRSI